MTAMEKVTGNLTLGNVDQNAILRHLGINANDPASQALMLVCQKYDLDPILKHALLIKGRLYVTRDGLMHVAHRSGKFDGMEVLEQGETTSHYTAKVSVWRKDMGRPFSYIGRYPKSGQIAKDYGPEMAVKVAEVMALRRAFDVALGAAEERWDEEAQREMEQAAAVQEAKPVTTQEAKPAAQLPPDPKEEALQAWAKKIGDMAERVRSLGASENVSAIEKAHAWRTDLDAARLCYDQLKALGMELHNGKAQPMTAEAMLTPEQRGQLQAVAKASGATSSQERYALWGYMFNHPTPIATNNLTEAQAVSLLDSFSAMNPDERAQCLAEARAQFKVVTG